MKFDIELYINGKLNYLYDHLEKCKLRPCEVCKQNLFIIGSYEELLYYIDKFKQEGNIK